MTRPVFAALALCSAAIWFGVRLGTHQPLTATPEAARVAAQGFVEKAALKNGGADVQIHTDQAAHVGDEWTVSGSGTATIAGRPQVRIEWQTRQQWTPAAHRWRLKAVTITRQRTQ